MALPERISASIWRPYLLDTPDPMQIIPVLIFLLTYAGVTCGGYPGLAIDRTGVALIGALAMVIGGILSPREAIDAVHFPTLLLLYGLMIISAQLRLGGFYTMMARRIAGYTDRPGKFLFITMVVGGLLAAVLANDIICLAFTPVLANALKKRGINPVPFLLGLAMATNLGSASTIIGNPQSMLIGQVAALSFADFLFWCAPPSLAGIFATYLILVRIYRDRFFMPCTNESCEPSAVNWPEFNKWQSGKGLAASIAAIVMMFSSFPREWSVLTISGILLLSRKMHTRAVLGIVDWHLITLFCGLFVVVRGLNMSGIPERAVAAMAEHGIGFGNPFPLALLAVGISNLVSNVPATVLLIPHIPAGDPVPWYVLSLGTTYAGNLFTIGSMANLIVIEQARLCGVHIGFREYARTGILVTTVNILLLFLWILVK